MFRKRPYFLKKKEWYVKTELAGTETYKLTEEGCAIKKQYKAISIITISNAKISFSNSIPTGKNKKTLGFLQEFFCYATVFRSAADTVHCNVCVLPFRTTSTCSVLPSRSQ